MKVQGNVFTEIDNNQGLKTATNGTVYAHLSLSAGNQVYARDAQNNVIMENGQPKQIWNNVRYSLTLFGEMAKALVKQLEEAKKAGKKTIQLEVSGEHNPGTYIVKSGPDKGKERPSNAIRVISMRIPGEALWTTTAGGQLTQRQLN